MSTRILPVTVIVACVAFFSSPFAKAQDSKSTTAKSEPTKSPLNSTEKESAKKKSPAQTPRERMLDRTLQLVDLAHAQLFQDDPYPSAKKCAACHETHFQEWSVSPHAYAQLSPVFNAMSNKLVDMTNGTMGDFCMRCHTPVGMALDEPINTSNLNRHPTSREGVTCVVCHRINQAWGKGAGRQALRAGDLTTMVSGPRGSDILQSVIDKPDKYGALTTEKGSQLSARKIHGRSERFFALTTPGFCGSCHDVFAPNGFRLEDAFSEYKASPAAKNGTTCQDCHMGHTPGKAEGYSFARATTMKSSKGKNEIPIRKHTNHMMAGPDYSVIHVGLFPHNTKALKEKSGSGIDGLATMREWLLFDEKAQWGESGFEQKIATEDPKGTKYQFPECWSDPFKRIEARSIINEQKALLKKADKQRYRLLRAGYQLGDIQVTSAGRDLRFQAPVSNITDGHGVPTGFDAERLVYVRARVWNGNNRLVFQSGDLDANGDLRDSHSALVHNGEVPVDRQLFTLQTRFITRNVRGGEREQILAVPYSLDPLPYIRPETRPFTVLGRPLGARKHKQNIEVGGRRMASYVVPARQLRGPGPFKIQMQLISGMVPVNLVHEISSVGFDYGMSAKEIADRVVDGHMILYSKTTSFGN